MFIKFKKLIFRNVGSYGNKPTTFDFEKGLNLVTAENGQGKSTIISALTYNLYGKPYTKIKIEELINRTNKKDMYTECYFDIGNDSYKLIRSKKPDALKIEKNGQKLESLSSKVLTQDEIDKILGIDYELFKNCIALAVSYNKPFLTLSAADKRGIVESIFNIQIFGEMLQILKGRISKQKVEIEVQESNLKIVEDNLKTERQNVLNLKKIKDSFEENKKKDLDNLNFEIEQKTKSKEISANNIINLQYSLDKNTVNQLQKKEELQKNIDERKLVVEKEIQETEKKIEENRIKIDEINDQDKKKKLDIKNKYEQKKIEEEVKYQENKKGSIEQTIDIKRRIDLIGDIKETKNLESQLVEFIKEKSKNESLIEGYESKKKFWETKDYCIECETPIEKDKRDTKIHDLNNQIEYCSASNQLITEKQKKIKEEIDKIKENNLIHQELTKELNEGLVKINTIEKEYKNLLESLKNQYELSLLKISDIEVSKIDTLLHENTTKISQLKNDYELNNLKSKLDRFDLENQSYIDSIKSKIKIELSKTEMIDSDIELSKKKIDEISKRIYDINIDDIEKEFEEKCESYKVKYQDFKKLTKQLDYSNAVANILSDKGIKSFFFRKLIPLLNQKICDYLTKFRLPVIMQFNEMMEEKICSLNGRDENISYYTFSGGERTRLDLSILLSFIDIMKSITNFSCSLLFLDEILDSQVDQEGLDTIIESIKNMVDNSKNLGVYIISHKLQNTENIDRIINIKKVNGFSVIEKN